MSLLTLIWWLSRNPVGTQEEEELAVWPPAAPPKPGPRKVHKSDTEPQNHMAKTVPKRRKTALSSLFVRVTRQAGGLIPRDSIGILPSNLHHRCPFPVSAHHLHAESVSSSRQVPKHFSFCGRLETSRLVTDRHTRPFEPSLRIRMQMGYFCGSGVIRQDERKAFVNAGRLVVTNQANFLKVRFWQIIDIDRFSAVDPLDTKS